jgi:hypothetical protein
MKRLLLLGLAGSLLLAASCRKSETVQVIVPGYVGNANDFVKKFGPQRQISALVTTELPQTIQLNNGTIVTIPANSIQRNGNYISGNISVEVTEYFKRSDIILGGINTDHYDGSPMDTRGILHVDILFNGNPVDKLLTNLMNVSIPATAGGYIRISSGNTNVNGNQLAWGPEMVDSINSDGSKFNFSTMRIGWLNCGTYYAGSNAKTTLAVKLTNNHGTMATHKGASGNSFVYFCPKNTMVAMQLYASAGENIVKTYDNAMPVGIEGRLIAFSIYDNKFYYSEKDITTTENSTETLNLAELSDTELVSKIVALDSY